MAQPPPDIVVRNSDIRNYFSNREWYEMSGYEKEQIRNVLRNHLFMISCGIKAPLPFFITNFEARQENLASTEQENQGSGSGSKGRSHPPKTSSKGERPPKAGAGVRQPLKVAKGRPRKSTVSSRRGLIESKVPMTPSVRGRGRPPKSKQPATALKGSKVESETFCKIASKSASLKSDSKLKSVPKDSSEQSAKPPANPSSNPEVPKKNSSERTRKQPPRLSKTACGIIIKNSIKS